MRIRMKSTVSGHYWISGEENPREWPRNGEEGDVPDDEGARLCAHGMAEPVATTPAESVKHAEKAVPRKRAEKRG